MDVYNYYIHVVKYNEELIEAYQSHIAWHLAHLNYLMKAVEESNTMAYTILLRVLLDIY